MYCWRCGCILLCQVWQSGMRSSVLLEMCLYIAVSSMVEWNEILCITGDVAVYCYVNIVEWNVI